MSYSLNCNEHPLRYAWNVHTLPPSLQLKIVCPSVISVAEINLTIIALSFDCNQSFRTSRNVSTEQIEKLVSLQDALCTHAKTLSPILPRTPDSSLSIQEGGHLIGGHFLYTHRVHGPARWPGCRLDVWMGWMCYPLLPLWQQPPPIFSWLQASWGWTSASVH